jgi:DNA-directed RNA polymerase specialized sigma24 family protein
MNSSESDGNLGTCIQEFHDGLRSRQDLVTHAESERWMRIFSYKYSYDSPGWMFGPDDLYCEARMNVVSKMHTLSRENTPNERAFVCWLKTVVRSTFVDELRKYKARGGALEQVDILELLNIRAPDENLEAKDLLKRFLNFIEIYSKTRQAAVVRWLDGYSYREIAKEVVDGDGNAVSHVTVGNWVIDAIADFRKSIGMPPPRRRATGRSSSGDSAGRKLFE